MYSVKDFIAFIRNNSPIRIIKNKIFSKKFLNISPLKSNIIATNSEIDIYIIAFNKPELILDQIYFLKKNLKDKYRLIIVDNSNKKDMSIKIEEICKSSKTSYVKLPNNKLSSSYSHALSLNYIMKNIILKQKTKYIGLLDHDCFLIKPIHLVQLLSRQQLFGTLMNFIPFKLLGHVYNMSGKRRIIRPGCAFYDINLFKNGYDFFPNKQFLPLSFLDTGGGNRTFIYKFFDIKKLKFLKVTRNEKIIGADNLGDKFIHLGGAGYKNTNTIDTMRQKLYEYYS